MNSAMIFENLRTLANRYVDLSLDFADLAAVLPENSNRQNSVRLLAALCHVKKPAGGESARILRDLETLQQDSSTKELLQAAIDEFLDSDVVRKAAQDNFANNFGPNASELDIQEIARCRAQLTDLAEFIGDRLREFRELQDDTGFTKQFDIRGIRGSVDNLSAYPILTSQISPMVSAPSPTSAPNGQQSFDRTVTGTIREVLGRSLKTEDTKSFLLALDHSFVATAVEGRTAYNWTPRSFVGQTDLNGGVTGGQASLYLRGKVAYENALPLLEGLFSLREDADPELVEASRNIVRSETREVVNELGVEGGPRVARVDSLFDLLFTHPFDVGRVDANDNPVPVTGHIALLGFEMGLQAGLVNTLDEEVNLTNFVAFSDYVSTIRSGWESFKTQFLGKDLGTRFVLLSRALSVVADSVREVYEAMNSVFVGPAERQVATFRDSTGRRILVSELLSWIEDFASLEAPRLVQDGGRRGAQTIIPTAVELSRLIERLLGTINTEADLPIGMRQPRVQFPLRELRSYLEQVVRLATDVKRPATVA